ncbi:ABC transporter substrate-binding protein [Streptomyces sp. NPDC004752]
MLGSDNKTITGMEPDLMNAIGEVLGVKVKLTKASFDSMVAGVQAHRYNLAIQAMLDTPERQKFVTFVDCFKTSSSILVTKSRASAVGSLADVCGLNVAVEQGTAQVDDVKEQSAKCSKAGKTAAHTLVFPNSAAGFQAVSTGRADAFVGGTPTIAYQAQQSNGQMKAVGKPYRFLRYGILVDKSDTQLVQAVQKALQQLIDNGSYTKILKQWSVESGNIGRATVNGGGAR